jgi:hypothetical protein
MDDSDQTRDAATFTRLDVWRPLFAKAQLMADGATAAEIPPVAGCEQEEPTSPEVGRTTVSGPRTAQAILSEPSARPLRRSATSRSAGSR